MQELHKEELNALRENILKEIESYPLNSHCATIIFLFAILEILESEGVPDIQILRLANGVLPRFDAAKREEAERLARSLQEIGVLQALVDRAKDILLNKLKVYPLIIMQDLFLITDMEEIIEAISEGEIK